MNWFLNLLFLCGVQTVLSKSVEKAKQPDNKEVNTFLEKILQADKFEELADRIAEKAVKKLSDFQKAANSRKLVTDDGIYRSHIKTSEDYSFTKPRRLNKHKHGRIDVDAVLKKAALPVENLKLRYKHLKNVHAKAALRLKENEESMNIDRNEENQMDNDKMLKHSQENFPQTYSKLAQDVQFDFDHNIKTLSDEDFKNPFGDGQTISWNKKSPKYVLKNNRSFRSDTNVGQISENTSREEYQNSTRTTRTEGDKQFILEDHPDYKEYHEELAKNENFSAREKSFL